MKMKKQQNCTKLTIGIQKYQKRVLKQSGSVVTEKRKVIIHF